MSEPKPAVATATISISIPLKHPFTAGNGNRIETLTLRRGTRADMKAAGKYSPSDAEQEDFLFARLSGLTIEDIEQLDLADSKALQDSFRKMVEG